MLQFLNKLLAPLIISICQFLARHLPSSTIAKDGLKYLSRYYFFLKDRWFFNVYLHEFHRSDADVGTNGLGLLHSHPFKWSLSFVLIGGYSEERLNPDGTITTKLVKPFTFNFISHKDFHRVDLVQGKAWTIFFTGPRDKNLSWKFYDRITKEFIDWKSVPGAIE